MAYIVKRVLNIDINMLEIAVFSLMKYGTLAIPYIIPYRSRLLPGIEDLDRSAMGGGDSKNLSLRVELVIS
jgi:hypothetical protein